MTAPTRPALRWFGGKWRIAPWIISHFPPHEAYCEPYGGSASVLLRKPRARLETWNDLHGRLVTFFRVLRERPAELVAALELTPYARAEYDLAHERHADPLEDARRFYVLACQGRVGAAGDPSASRRTSGWRVVVDKQARHGTVPAEEFADLGHLYEIAARFKGVQIEQLHAAEVLGRYDRPGVLHYVDPPYHDPDSDLRNRYAYAMTADDHVALAEVLHCLAGMVILSGRPSRLYDRLFGDWQRIDRPSLLDSGRLGIESLWLSPAAVAAQPQGRLAL